MTASIGHTARTSTINWGRYFLVGLATIIGATIANLIVYYIAGAFVFYNPEFLVLSTPGGTIIFTVVPAIIATILYAPILRFTSQPARIFTIIAVIVLIVSVIPDFTYIPTVPGSSPGQTTVLVVMHVVAAAVITGMLTRLNAPRER